MQDAPALPSPGRPAQPDPVQPEPAQSAPNRHELNQPAAAQPVPDQPAPPKGKVLFSRSDDADMATEPQTPASAPAAPAVSSSDPDAHPFEPGPPDAAPARPVLDEERAAILITAWDLDLHLVPAEAREEMHATLSVRNTGTSPLSRLPLQISGSLRWQAITAAGAGVGTGAPAAVPFTQSPVETDTDHTGFAQEAVLSPSAPLAPGASLTLSVFYTGTIRPSAGRLERLGTDPARAALTDWDQIAPATDDNTTALRGFGDVLWYPVAAPLALLGDGNRLFELVGRERRLEAAATICLRLTVEYAGEPPDGVLFLGELRPLVKLPDEQDKLVADTHGLATVEFPARPLGLRPASLFLTAAQPVTSENQLMTAISAHLDSLPPYVQAAGDLQPMFSAWFGASPLKPLLLFDHEGEPFADHAFIAAHLAADADPAGIASAIVGPETASWFESAQPWIADGLAGMMSSVWAERRSGREAAMAQLNALTLGLNLVEPDLSPGSDSKAGGQPLISATSRVYLQGKATAVWWQLREILGEDVLRQALTTYRHTAQANPAFDADPKAMQGVLERVSGKPLAWFFDDWVYRDRGLPDLTIGEVNPRPLPVRAGKSGGYLVAVEVRNEGDAVAEVPVTVRSATLTATERLRVPGHGVASTRVLFEDTPTTVQVNDGSTPEVRTTEHTRQIEIGTR